MLVFADGMWHKTPAPVFIERFILPLFSAVVILLAFTNPMGFDRTQRITGVAGVIFLAYFFAHTAYKKSQPVVAAPYAVAPSVAFVSDKREGSPIWISYQSAYGNTLSPAQIAPHVSITNLKPVASMITNMSIELQGDNKEWFRLQRLPTNGGPISWMGSDRTKANLISFVDGFCSTHYTRNRCPLENLSTVGFSMKRPQTTMLSHAP